MVRNYRFILNCFIFPRLKNPNSCEPSWGPRYNVECAECTKENLFNSGLTFFSKIRLDLETLRIISNLKLIFLKAFSFNLFLLKGNDFSFATARYGSLVPFATAGDCYSLQSHCIQVKTIH